MGRLTWTCFDVVDLVDAANNSRLVDCLPKQPGVYLYKRSLRCPPNCLTSSTDCFAWIKSLTSQPSARLGKRQINHCVWIDGLSIGGGGLTLTKELLASESCKNPKMRRLIVSFVESLSDYMPVIYAGQTDCLLTRTRQHLNGETGLYEYIREMLKLDWTDLELRFMPLAPTTDMSVDARAVQELLELVTQRILAPFATERPG